MLVSIKKYIFDTFCCIHNHINPKNAPEIRSITQASFNHKFHLKLFTASTMPGFWFLNGEKWLLTVDSTNGLPKVNAIKNKPIKLNINQNHRGLT